MAQRTIKLLDLTIDGGKVYHVVGIYTSIDRAKEAVRKFITKYNNSRDRERGEVEFHYSDDIWQHTDEAELVFPFGPGAEYRIRQLVLNQPIKD
jgi:hypothetical protein